MVMSEYMIKIDLIQKGAIDGALRVNIKPCITQLRRFYCCLGAPTRNVNPDQYNGC